MAMQENLCIAISGTPGSGKTSLSKLFEQNNISVYSVKDLAEQYGCIGEIDKLDGAQEIDIHRLADEWQNEESGLIIIDGHLSHFLDVDAVVLLRCDPKDLENRLTARGYSEQKVNANSEWELMAGIWSELLEFEIELPIVELDSTKQSSEELFKIVNDWILDGLPYSSISEESQIAIDWIEG
jgi:adenylate kinase